ncbi:hypothetical protein LCGC14_1316830 [marine sediment metagenome]|uniref:Uncharacterized protein n=1 Tax=marine sediment metagenome TaxID=412755 RepID=A0A0F9L603_9ZZZZ
MMTYPVSSGEMYQVLRDRNVALRRPFRTKTNPTPKETKTTPKEIKLAGTASNQLRYGLELLKDDVITAFGQAMDKTREQYKLSKYGDSDQDVYYETLFERSDLESTTKMLAHWIKYLNALPDCQHTRGAVMTLTTLMELAIKIDKLDPGEGGEGS